MNTVQCPHCGKKVEISEAFKHQIGEQIRDELSSKHKVELEKQRQEIEQKAISKTKDEFEFKMKDFQNTAKEEKEKNRLLQEQLLELNKLIRDLKTKDETRELEMEKKFLAQRDKLQEDVTKSLKEKTDLEKAELQKQLDDTKKALEEAQRKAAQKSQQLQGEVLELELEQILTDAFPHDTIEPIGKGVTGADIRHIVKSPKGYTCGVILWEFKRTKEWRDIWLGKLKDDLRAEKAHLPVIVSMELPKEAEKGFGVKDGVWVCSLSLVLPLATLLRKNLLDLGYQKAVSANRGSKADLLYSYITSNEFQQQVENIIEVYQEMQTQIQKERLAFEKSWKQREAQTQRLLLSTARIIGSMQGVVGASMPQIKGLELPDIEIEDGQKTLLE